MRPPRTGRRAPRVLSGGHLRFLLLLFALSALPATLLPIPRPAAAQEDAEEGGRGEGKGGKGGGEKEKPRRKGEEEVLLESLGKAWKEGDAGSLAARMPARRRVSLRLPGSEAGDYRAEQARSILVEYFEGRTLSRVDLESVREMTGTFSVEYVRRADRRRVEGTLVLVLGVEGKKRVLVGAREGP